MITIRGMHYPFDTSGLTALEKQIYEQKQRSPFVYEYDSAGQLRFELVTRGRIVESARALLASRARFATYARSRCNEAYWIRTGNGGFRQKAGVSSSEAVKDIFLNGPLYAFECSMGAVIVLYKAVMDVIGEERFDIYFRDLYLWDWHYDSDLRLITLGTSPEAFPGDILYFKNPDFSPETPQWQGVNAVKLGEDLYYGHGVGIRNADGIVAVLNKYRKEGAARPAYLMEQASFPDFKYLFWLSSRENMYLESIANYFGHKVVAAKIGSSSYVMM